MRALQIALKDLRVAYRDRTGLLLLLVMPLVLIAVLGAVFGGTFAQSPTIEPFTVALVDQDDSYLSDVLWQVLSGDELRDLITAQRLTLAEAEEQIRQGQIAGGVVVPAGFSASVLGDGSSSLQLLRDPGQELRASILQSIIQSFADHLVASRLTMQELLSSGQAIDPLRLGQQVAAQVAAAEVQVQKDVVVPGAQISSFQYYAFAMACMFLLMAGHLGLQSLAVEHRNQTYARTMVTPTGKLSFLLGKVGGQVAIGFTQFLILAVGTRVAYGVVWGSWPAVLLTGFVYSLSVGGLSVLVSSLVSNPAAGIGAWNIGVQIFTALGGGMVPLSQFPGFMQKVAMVSPVYWGLKSFLALGMGQAMPWNSVLPLLAVGVVAIVLGTLRLARN